MDDRRAPAEECESPHLTMLVHRAKPTKKDIVADDNMPAKGCVIGKDHMVANNAVMAHMRARHEKSVIADPGFTAARRRTDIHGCMFTDNIMSANGQAGVLATVTGMLRRAAQPGKGMHLGTGANVGPPLYRDVAMEHHIVVKGHMRANNTKRPYTDGFG